VRLEIRFQHT